MVADQWQLVEPLDRQEYGHILDILATEIAEILTTVAAANMLVSRVMVSVHV